MFQRFRNWLARLKRRIVSGFLAVLAALGLYTGAVYSQTVTDVLTWTNPTTRIDGAALTNLASTRISWGKKGGPYTDGSRVVAAPGTTASIQRTGTGIGTICYIAVAIDADGLESTSTGEVCKTVNAIPSAVTGLAVQ